MRFFEGTARYFRAVLGSMLGFLGWFSFGGGIVCFFATLFFIDGTHWFEPILCLVTSVVGHLLRRAGELLQVAWVTWLHDDIREP